MENIFKVGDVVYYLNCKGEVRNSIDVGVLVRFDGWSDWFYISSMNDTQHIKFISFTPYTIEQTKDGLLLKGFSQVRPYEPKKGDLVLVSDDERTWYVTFFDRMSKDGNLFITNPELNYDGYCNADSWKYCKPYLRDEPKQSTTTENADLNELEKGDLVWAWDNGHKDDKCLMFFESNKGAYICRYNLDEKSGFQEFDHIELYKL